MAVGYDLVEVGTSATGDWRRTVITEAVRGRVIAAALTPFRADGTVVHEAVGEYAEALRASGAGGIAVGAHTGRGGRLPLAEEAALVAEFGAASGLPIVAGLNAPGPAEGALGTKEVLRAAERLAEAGAAALLVAPPADPGGGCSPERVLEWHRRVGESSGLPLIGFVLYQRASRCQYDAALAAELALSEHVLGVKVALLDDAMGCQDLIARVRERAPDALVLSGEDRMYGPSLMWGADSALVGIAAALPAWSVEVLSAWNAGDHSRFVAASARLDALAQVTFTEPMEGYVQRMAWVAEWQGILPPDAVFDPYGPRLPAAERDRIRATLATLSASQ